MNLSRGMYTRLLYILTPLVMTRLLVKGIRNRDYLRRWNERFGLYRDQDSADDSLWIHCVSVGEFQAAIPFIRRLLQQQPQQHIVITTTTPTGSARVRNTFGDQVYHVYLPYDLPGAVSRFLDHARPRVAIIMETELWPNLFAQCRERAIPLLIANARLSPHSMEGYRRFPRLVKEALAIPRHIATQGNIDRQRFIKVGAPEDRVNLMGNLKFDLDIDSGQLDVGRQLRQRLGQERPVWIAASTHEGEETQVLDAFELLRRDLPEALLILVPRHPERFAGVARLCRRRNFRLVRRTEDNGSMDADIYLGDTLGELVSFYRAADIAFVGGSLVPVGGHNMLEASALGLPVITGPHLFNFPEISAALLEAGAMREITDSARLAELLLRWFRDPAQRTDIGDKGRQIVEQNRGALERLLVLTGQMLRDSASR